MTKALIFDLDHTVIDSSHRQITKPCGSLDLAHWLENSTREKIFADKLMPLADEWRRNIGQRKIFVCTARSATQDDIDFLIYHGLYFDEFYCRAQGDMSGDAALKTGLLNPHLQKYGIAPEDHLMWDDNDAVRVAVTQELRIPTKNPREF